MHLCVHRMSALVLAVFLMATAANGMAADKTGKKPQKKGTEEEAKVEPAWPSPLDPGKFDMVYTLLPFGKDRSQFMSILTQRFQQQLQPVLKATLDPHQRDILRTQMEKDLGVVEKSWRQFDGKDSGYSISVIAKEFFLNAGEAVLKYMYGSNAAYFLFSGNNLRELFLCVEPSTDFNAMLERLGKAYKTPAKVTYKDPETKAEVIEAKWRDTTFELTARPKSGIFKCNRLSWVYLPSEEGVKVRREAAKTLTKPDSSSSDILNQVMQDPGDDVDNILDSVLKKEH